MPGKVDYRIRVSIDMLNDVLLQDVIWHAKGLALWVELFLLQIVAVLTIQVADGTNGFGENLKLAGSLYHLRNPPSPMLKS
jgi:hypothetical protein